MRCSVLLLVVAAVQSGFCSPIIADESIGPSESRQSFGKAPQRQPALNDNITYIDFPSSREIRRAIPDGKVRPGNGDIQCELLKYNVEDAKYYPIVGCACLAHIHFKCTVTSGEDVQLVYIVHTHLIPVK